MIADNTTHDAIFIIFAPYSRRYTLAPLQSSNKFGSALGFLLYLQGKIEQLMISKYLLFPYYLTLKIRNYLYDSGAKKQYRSEIPTICIGNVTVGGTGKTPHTEMILKTLLSEPNFAEKRIAVLSRGYKRKKKGFQQVVLNGTARDYGDEPLQIKRKFPEVGVIVDKDRVRGCHFLAHPQEIQTSKITRKCLRKDVRRPQLIVLDDAFQYRRLKPSLSIVLIDYNRPTFEDELLPIGQLRDLPERVSKADVIIVTKCPRDLNSWNKSTWAEALGLCQYDATECTAHRKDGSIQKLFFTTIQYETAQPVFPEGDMRYTYSKRLILLSGIADNSSFKHYLSDSYKILRQLEFKDHHKFSSADINSVYSASRSENTAVVMTTEKDCQRIRDCKYVPEELKKKMFYIPISVAFFSDSDKDKFIQTLVSVI